MIIESAEHYDVKQLTDLMYLYIVDFYKRPKPPIEKIHHLIEMLFEKNRDIQFVAEQDEELVGFATLYFSFTTKADKIVIEKARGTGAAKELFKRCETFTKENGYAHMSWIIASDNYHAQKFYEKMGGSLGNWLTYSI
ncbi:N-acetyltransferase family protein [Bacillus sp. ICE1]|uniref:GNAT family N-acetyltransferase n=1 Tax=Bacillus TaxID=1386 RepID=UPI001E56F680|nr:MULTISPECIES: GNAT family N-acetyltransferase [unclassified Bacillus (in: firmicutes)]MCC8304825.1 GNAT family N-acetyltransferase [Bacillus sp. AF12]MDV9077809.1 GNAT family N-acetyltransferase [Bacillus sp. ICE1]